MDMQRILTVFNSLQNNNLSATPPMLEPQSFSCNQCQDTGMCLCPCCNGTGLVDDNSGILDDGIPCNQCSDGKIVCDCQSNNIHETIDSKGFNKPYKQQIERCFKCDEPTGRAGKGDDSLYDSDGVGPYCQECYDKKFRDPLDESFENTDEEHECEICVSRNAHDTEYGWLCDDCYLDVEREEKEKNGTLDESFENTDEEQTCKGWLNVAYQALFGEFNSGLIEHVKICLEKAQEECEDKSVDCIVCNDISNIIRYLHDKNKVDLDRVKFLLHSLIDRIDNNDEVNDNWDLNESLQDNLNDATSNYRNAKCRCGHGIKEHDNHGEDCLKCACHQFDPIHKSKIKESTISSTWGNRIRDIWEGIAHDLMAIGGVDADGAREAVSQKLYDDFNSWRHLNSRIRQELLKQYLSDDEVAAANPEIQDNLTATNDFDDEHESDDDIDKWYADYEANQNSRVPESNDEGSYCPSCGEVFDSSKKECGHCHVELFSESKIVKRKIKESICKNCTADGVIPCQACNGHSGNEKCEECHGEGEITCPECNGNGHIKDKKMKSIRENFNAEMDECSNCEGRMESSQNNLSINTSYDSSTNRRSISISAENEKAEELADILRLSGLLPGSENQQNSEVTDPEFKVEIEEPLMDDKLTEAKSYSIQARKTKTSPITYLSLAPTKWVKTKDDAHKFTDLESAATKAASIKDKQEVTDVKVVPNLNESQLNEFHAKGHECDFCGNPLSQNDYTSSRGWSYHCGSCGFRYNHNGETAEAQIRKQLKSGKIDKEDSLDIYESTEPKRIKHPGVKCIGKDCKKTARWRMTDGKMMCDSCKSEKDKKVNESLSPERKETGVNDAPKAWANEPNEQIAHWRAVVDDTQGLSKPQDMFPNRLGDNPLKVAKDLKDEKLHENVEINKIAINLANKFSKLDESDEMPSIRHSRKLPHGKYIDDGEAPFTMRFKAVGLNQNEGKETTGMIGIWADSYKEAIDKARARVEKNNSSPTRKWNFTITELVDMFREDGEPYSIYPRRENGSEQFQVDESDENNERDLREKLSSLKKRYHMAVTAHAPNRYAIKAEIERVKNKLADSVPDEPLTENEAKYAAIQLNLKHIERKLEEEGFIHNSEKEEDCNRSAHIFTRGNNGEFISLSKDGKWDWAYHNENGDLTDGSGKDSLNNLLNSLEFDCTQEDNFDDRVDNYNDDFNNNFDLGNDSLYGEE